MPTPPPPPLLRVQNLSCNYGKHPAVTNASFELQQGMLASLLGPSGCGKTTLLRALAGFHPPHAGQIDLHGKPISAPLQNRHLPPEARNLGMVFQEHALFPHLSVEQNVTAGLHNTPNKTKTAQQKIAHQMLTLVGLPPADFAPRYPHQLSGGQQQRVALARALAPRPRLLLMDEPFSNLDPDLREKMRQEIRALLKQIGATCLLVTHDQQDAFTFGERVGVMRAGRIEQWDTAYRLYHEPQTRFVADFIGEGVFLPGTVTATGAIETELATLQQASGDSSPAKNNAAKTPQPPSAAPTAGDSVQVLIRPDDILHDDASPRTAKIKKRTFRGENYLYTLTLPSGREILSLVPSHHKHAVGEDLGIVLDIDHLVVFPAQ